jgi:hypothetical protein
VRAAINVSALPADHDVMTDMDWDRLELDDLVRELRENVGGPDGEKMIWAFEQAIRVARIDPELLEYMLAAVVCLLARSSAASPRAVLEDFFRRSITDQEWRERYLPLFP